MTKEELQARIEKKEKDIEKINKRILKWTSGMNDKAKQIVKNCELVYDDPKYKEAYQAYKEYKDNHTEDETVFRQDGEWNKGPDFSEAYSAYRDLADAKNTLNKYNVQLDKITNFENEEKIEVIWKFLQEWKERAYKFYVKNVELYYQLELNYQEKLNEYMKDKEFNCYRNKLIAEGLFEREYYNDIERLTKMIYTYKGKYDDKLLVKILNKEVTAKYKNLVNQVTAKAGEIVDASNLYIDDKGGIAGIVKGNKNTVRLWTTFVVGEIQCPHYRSYANIIK